jgi:3-phytase
LKQAGPARARHDDTDLFIQHMKTFRKPNRVSHYFFFLLLLSVLLPWQALAQTIIKPLVVTQPVAYDSDDPAVWINRANPAASLIIGTDKDSDGALYVFDLQGKILQDKVVDNLKRPNNVDVAYGLSLQGRMVDIAVTTERLGERLRVFSLPDMRPIDGGGITVFAGESSSSRRAPMGIGLYKRPSDGKLFAIVSRAAGPTNGTYLWQYLLEDDGTGKVKGTLVRKFGNFSGKEEIEAVAVDNELGYVYYSDEQAGVRKYYADPDRGNQELALFATSGFGDDQEGIALYKIDDGTGYILVSDQRSRQLHIYPREGTAANPHSHPLLKVVDIEAKETDGIEMVNYPLPPQFPNGMLVAMSSNKTFHYYRWEDIAGNDLKIKPPGTNLPPPPVPPTGGLVGHWKFDEANGKILLDASGYENHAAVVGSPNWVSGVSGLALNLDGSIEYGKVADHATLDISGPISLAGWIRPKKRATQNILKKAVNGSTNGYELSLSSDGKVFFRFNQTSSGDAYRLNSLASYPSNGSTWMHIAATYDGKTIRMYINGVENSARVLSSPPAIRTNSLPLTIGAQSNGKTRFEGALDEMRIYNKTLTAAEVSALMVVGATSKQSTTTAAAVLEDQQEEPLEMAPEQELQAYPNPFSLQTSISFVLAETGAYTLSLYDAKGAQLRILGQGMAPAGERISVSLEDERLARGLYLVKLQTTEGIKTLRLLHTR